MYGVDGFFDDDSLQRKIETMRGLPLKTIAYPEDDEFHEVSDAVCLCKEPVVSVVMITYNHEKYIRQAIEGVVNQKTDFEFELIISEDCSTDTTRKICLEYQKKYPSIIRVLYADLNTRVKYGRILTGSRALRVRRAELIALCEGDDYWTDENKLQRQFDVFRKYPSVSMCYTRTKVLIDATGAINEPAIGIKPGLIKGIDFWQALIWRRGTKINTCSVMYRWSKVRNLYDELRFPKWDLTLGDVPLFICCASVGDVFLVDSFCCMYRINQGSAVHTGNGIVGVDNGCVSAYLSYLLFHLPLSRFPLLAHSFRVRLLRIAKKHLPGSRWQMYRRMFSTSVYLPVIVRNPFVLLYVPLSYIGILSARISGFVSDGLLKTIRVQFSRRIINPITRAVGRTH